MFYASESLEKDLIVFGMKPEVSHEAVKLADKTGNHYAYAKVVMAWCGPTADDLARDLKWASDPMELMRFFPRFW